jgi:hypothetical protein
MLLPAGEASVAGAPAPAPAVEAPAPGTLQQTAAGE